MQGISRIDSPVAAEALVVREPKQRRTREQWQRILTAGVELLEVGGYEAFTIAALSERAEVAPRALYARASTKDALFLAVYEHGMSRVLAGHASFAGTVPEGPDAKGLQVQLAVSSLIGIFLDNADFLRAVVLLSAAHPEVRRRGEAYRGALRDVFLQAVGEGEVDGCDDETRRTHELCFSVVFSAMVVHVAYGSGFGLPGDGVELGRGLVTIAQRYLGTATT